MKRAEDAGNLPIMTSVILSVIVIIASLFLTMLTSKYVSRPLKQLSKDIREVAAGNLSLEIHSKRPDEIGELANAFATMIDEMNEVMHEAKTVVDRVQSSASILTVSATDVMNQMDDQAVSVSQASTTVNEMRSQSEEIRDHATEAAAASDTASHNSSEGREVVTQTINEMQHVSDAVASSSEIINRLGEASKEISAIVATISDIADQTNLLALNAAIEAARAGEHGRGFAVVADEVRKLAEKVSKSANEIIGLISTFKDEAEMAVKSMDKGAYVVEKGVEFANNAGQSLGKILQAVSRVDSLMEQTQQATVTQVNASEDVASTLSRLKQVSAATSESAHGTSREAISMEATIGSLAKLLSHFKLRARTKTKRISKIMQKANYKKIDDGTSPEATTNEGKRS